MSQAGDCGAYRICLLMKQSEMLITTNKKEQRLFNLAVKVKYIILVQKEIQETGWPFYSSFAEIFVKSCKTASFVGSAGIAPLCVTVRAPQAFAKRRASLNRSSSC